MITESNIQVSSFEEQYFALRLKENRIYSNDIVKKLPEIHSDDVNAIEWKIRKRSAKRLYDHLLKKKTPLNILEVGCGNGWLSHYLSKLPSSTVVGTDINQKEIEQAKEVFADINNLSFSYADIRNEIFTKNHFDAIVFAASIQYFKSVELILTKALQLLKPTGEIHILDTHFYNAVEIVMAKRRSHAYFEQIGHPEMSLYYYHHQLTDLKKFKYKILQTPVKNIFRNEPFYHIVITH